jgi:hypothetical protein
MKRGVFAPLHDPGIVDMQIALNAAMGCQCMGTLPDY